MVSEMFSTRLVPIRVGMIPDYNLVGVNNFTCPHTRGDDPTDLQEKVKTMRLSPYAWG